MNRTIGILLVLCTVLALAAQAQERRRSPPPNILFILADDLGYGDVSAFNPESKITTPHIDRLVREGMRFTDAHAAGSVCVPSRYGLLTGRYPFRNERRAAREALIEPGRMTVASLLKQAGYDTAMLGKWHLSFDGGTAFDYSRPLRGGPVDRGFDTFFGLPASLDIPPYFYVDNDRPLEPPTDTIEEHHSPDVTPIQGAFWRAGAVAPHFKHADVLPEIARRAVRWLESRRGATQPFFLYLALPAPHTPWLPAKEFRGKSGAGDYGDYTLQVDDAVGQALAALDRAGHTRDTLVFFTSDNGPCWYPEDVRKYGHRSAGPYRGMKGDAWEGGHRMPFAARWPGKIARGSSSKQRVCFTDVLATAAAITGRKLPENAAEDSFDFSPTLLGKGGSARDVIVHQSSSGALAIRQGDWKLIPQLGGGGFTRPARIIPKPGEPAGQLYNLADDPAEQQNLYAGHPEIVRRLTELLARIRSEGRSRR